MSWYKTFFPYIKRSLFLSRQKVLTTCYPIKLQEEFFPCPQKRKSFARWCKLRMQLLELLRDLLLHKITVLKYIFLRGVSLINHINFWLWHRKFLKTIKSLLYIFTLYFLQKNNKIKQQPGEQLRKQLNMWFWREGNIEVILKTSWWPKKNWDKSYKTFLLIFVYNLT